MINQLGPYELNQIYCRECSEGMSALPDNCIDLTVTSPPYDSLREYRGYTFDFEAIAAQLWRVTKEGGVVVWVVADETKDGSESGTSFRQALGFMAGGFNLHDTMIYEVMGTGAKGSNYAYWQAFEYMFVFSKGTPKTVNRIADIKNTNFGKRQKGSNGGRDGKNGNSTDRIRNSPEFSVRPNIWRFSSSSSERTDHDAPFPEALARDHILSWSNPGDIVLDPMTGSGTTCKLAHLLGRHYLGFEISAEYCELARRRVANVEAQPFLMPPIAETNGKPMQAAMFETT